MKEIREEQCGWHDAARESIEDKVMRDSYNQTGCYTCNGRDTDCRKYIPIIKTWSMQQNTRPYEDSMRKKKK